MYSHLFFSSLEPRVGQVLQLRSHYSPTPKEREQITHAYYAYQWYRSATRSSVLFREFRVMPRISQMFTDEYGNPTSIQMKIAQAWEVEDEQIPGGRRSIPRKMSVEEVAALLDQTLEESITRRNSVVRRGNVTFTFCQYETQINAWKSPMYRTNQPRACHGLGEGFMSHHQSERRKRRVTQR